MTEPKIDKMIEEAKNKRNRTREEIKRLDEKLIREEDRTAGMLFGIIHGIGLLSLMSGTISILSGGIDLINGIAVLYGGVTSYNWHQSDKLKKSLREKYLT